MLDGTAIVISLSQFLKAVYLSADMVDLLNVFDSSTAVLSSHGHRSRAVGKVPSGLSRMSVSLSMMVRLVWMWIKHSCGAKVTY